jgi:RimJ/RimL family protein N-acetyltransferase
VPVETSSPIETDRLALTPLSAGAARALLAGDRRAADSETGLRWPDPFAVPPLVGQHLDWISDRVGRNPAEAPWWIWSVARSEDRQVVGAAGFGGPPDADGRVMLGYAVYPEWERRGYASEAARALTDWALTTAGAAIVRATMVPDNTASMRVARKAGLRRRGRTIHRDEGEVLVYEIARPG